jgi:hypothetical protein
MERWRGRRWKHGRPEPTGCAADAVMDAAALLDVTEFDLFRLAYRWRFGRLPAEAVLENAFAAYMLRGSVPPWVTALCREAIERRDRGVLDAEALGAGRFRDRPARPRCGVLWVGAAMAAWLAMMVCLLDLRPDPQSAATTAAECRGGPTLYHDWAAMIAGQSRASCGTALATGSR